MYKVLLVAVILSIFGGPFFGYMITISKGPIVGEIHIPDSASRNFLLGKGLDGIAYLSTGPTFSHFVYSCEPLPVSYTTHISPSCIYLGYDGKPGAVELSIPRYIITDFPIIDQVYYDGPLTLDERIPFQIVSKDTSDTIVRIEVPSNYSGITISGNDEGSLSPFYNYLLGWGLIMTISIFFATVILNALIGNKFLSFIHKMIYLLKRDRCH